MSQTASSPSPDVLDLFKKPVPSSALKRNTACHQCRKRKLKCDAKRPCATCLRSHAYAVAHATKERPAPPYPDCSYDEGAESPDEPPSKTKHDMLESRIGELEGLLREMTLALQEARADNARAYSSGSRQQSTTPDNMTTASTPSSSSSQPIHSPLPEASIFTAGAALEESMFSMSSQNGTSEMFFGSSSTGMDTMTWDSLDNFPASSYPAVAGNDFGILPDTSLSASFVSDTSTALTILGPQPPLSSQTGALLPSGWPPNLPLPDVTRHLVHAFFAFWIHAGRLFHGPTFLSSLDLPASDPRFPPPVVLHAICAVGSLYTADIAPTPVHTSRLYPYEVFTGKWRTEAPRPDSFAEQQVKFSQAELEYNVDRGERLIESLQAQVLVTWFYIAQGRWSESFLSAGNCLRYCNALGMIKAGPFQAPVPRRLARGKKAGVIAEPASLVEEETRRNIFWIAYAIERENSANTGFALELDDQDIDQMLPLRGDQFELGLRIAPEDRQWSHDRELLLTHAPERTDSFVLWLKATMLLSRVKAFNVRYKGRYFAGDAAYSSPSSSPSERGGEYDPRDSPAFQELDHAARAFRASFPPHLRDPIQDGTVDPHLYAACVGAHFAQIVLHDPHVSLKDPSDPSLQQISRASQAILELMYSVNATSYDISLLDQMVFFAWNFAARALIEFLKVAIDTNQLEQVFTIHNEICFVHSMLAKAGERMPVAYRYKRAVYDSLALVCGEQFVEPLPETSYHRPGYAAPSETPFLDPAPSIAPLFSATAITYPVDSPLAFCS
ncbi:Zn(II)2Cys6 transcription factor [Phanerochaete sordida]|uniref:Zn(II)2Cys6 transcription factor n=1 Tax=Phanerochaete sordida TaxID=48140 RepID=A0A9P3LA69_9APHY|nr:Zn(II)2Cys6 transcription factor [Phanerochaete sordida]